MPKRRNNSRSHIEKPALAEGVTVPPAKNPHAVALGKLGASKGGKAAAENMTPEQRRRRARKAARARWGKPRVLRKVPKVRHLPKDDLGRHLLTLFMLHPNVMAKYAVRGETLDDVAKRLSEMAEGPKQHLLARVERMLGIPPDTDGPLTVTP
jgi:hypothetical protein